MCYGPENGAVGGLGKRVDLNLRCVLFLENPIQVNEDVRRLLRRFLRRKSELLGNTDGRLFGEAGCKRYGRGDDGVRVLRGDIFNVHPALVRRYEDDTLRRTVVENGNIVLVRRLAELR